MKAKNLFRILKDHGYQEVRVTKHIIYSNGIKTIAIPNHAGKDLNKMTVLGILKQMKKPHEPR